MNKPVHHIANGVRYLMALFVIVGLILAITGCIMLFLHLILWSFSVLAAPGDEYPALIGGSGGLLAAGWFAILLIEDIEDYF